MEDFRDQANDPRAWLRASDSLWGAAEELVGGPRFVAWYLLTGMAVEDILKGLIVARDGIELDDRGRLRLPWPAPGHNLILLAANASVELTEEERQLVERLSEFVLWAGRYPIPRRLEEFRPRFLSAGDVTPARHLVGRLRGLLEKRAGGE
jgi:hypothetical protein